MIVARSCTKMNPNPSKQNIPTINTETASTRPDEINDPLLGAEHKLPKLIHAYIPMTYQNIAPNMNLIVSIIRLCVSAQKRV